MAITITKIDEEALKAEFKEKGFSDLKKYVENIVNKRHLQPETAQLPANHEEILLLNAKLTYAINKAVKAGINRHSLNKELSQITI